MSTDYRRTAAAHAPRGAAQTERERMPRSTHRRVGLVADEAGFWHESRADFGPSVEPGVQLETPEARRRLLHLIERLGLRRRMTPLEPLALAEADLARVHTADYLAAFRAQSAGAGGELGDFAGFGHGSYEIAVRSAGGVAAAVRAVLDGELDRAYALVRPPGHHAEPDRARGYCLLANIPIALELARARQGLGRVAIVDWDVHHGNGAQRIYWDDPDVLAISLHQDRLYPVESGAVEERGGDAALGATLNIPLPAGSGEGAYLAAFDRVVAPALRAFQPELLVVACGYDAAFLDPSSQMALTSATFGDLTRRVIELAEELCGGRLVIAQEGGYSPLYTPICGAAVVAALLEAEAETELHDPYGRHLHTPEQNLLPHQLEAIERAGAAAGTAPPTHH